MRSYVLAISTLLPMTNRISRAAKMLSKKGASKGGIARAKSLTPKQRSVISKKAADTRWGNLIVEWDKTMTRERQLELILKDFINNLFYEKYTDTFMGEIKVTGELIRTIFPDHQ